MRQAARSGGTTGLAGIHTAALVVLVLLVTLLAASSARAAETPPPAPVNTAAPTLGGTPAIGQTLTCSQGIWSNNPTGYSYAWLRNGAPIAGQAGSSYVVQAADEGQKISCQVTASNGGGSYTIVSLPSGSYAVEFYSSAGFFGTGTQLNVIPQYYSGKLSASEAAHVTVSAPNAVGAINAELQTGGQISGRVTDVTSKLPVQYTLACAEELAEKPVGGGCEFTNSGGEYTISGLSSGTYRVYFYSLFSETSYKTIFYNQKTLVGEANPVGVTAGKMTSEINAELTPVSQGGKISGKVTAETGGAAIANVEVCADETSGASYGGCATTNAGGEYTITNLPAGEFTVYFSNYGCVAGKCTRQNYVSQYYNREPNEGSADKITVIADLTTEPIDAKLAKGGQIAGTVTSAVGGARLAGVEVCVSSEDEYIGCELTNVNGEYTFPGLATGEYTVEFQTYPASVGNFASKSIEKVKVTAPNTAPPVNAALQAGGRLVGRVTAAASHAPLSGIEVCANEEHVFSECAETNANGEYEVAKMLTGAYTVSFYNENEKLNYQEQIQSGVSIAEGGQTNLNAEMQPGATISGRVVGASSHAGIADITVCARATSGNEYSYCALTTGAASASATSTSNVLTVPSGNFTQARAPKFEAKTGDLDFFLTFPTAGTLKWSLFFKNADVGFADSLGISLDANDSALAEVARKKGKAKPKKCKKTQTKHKGKCVATLVSFASGSQSVPAGTVEVKVHAGSKALKALKEGRTLHVSGTFTFQSALGGPPVAHTVSTVVHLKKKASKAKKHGKRK
jgi:Carboxypeptidase regulatory-like domain